MVVARRKGEPNSPNQLNSDGVLLAQFEVQFGGTPNPEPNQIF